MLDKLFEKSQRLIKNQKIEPLICDQGLKPALRFGDKKSADKSTDF